MKRSKIADLHDCVDNLNTIYSSKNVCTESSHYASTQKGDTRSNRLAITERTDVV